MAQKKTSSRVALTCGVDAAVVLSVVLPVGWEPFLLLSVGALFLQHHC